MIAANKVFDEMPRKDLDTWNALIFCFSKLRKDCVCGVFLLMIILILLLGMNLLLTQECLKQCNYNE